MATYYACDGTVSTVGNGTNQGLKCSTGWQTYTPPTAQTVELSGELLTGAQTSELVHAVIVLIALWAMFKIILHTFGVKL